MKTTRIMMPLLAALLLTTFGFGQQPDPADPAVPNPAEAKDEIDSLREQTIYIPYVKLQHVFEQPERGVFLPYEKFQLLWKQARAGMARPAQIQVPLRSLITAIDSQATVRGDVVRVLAKLNVEVLGKGWHEVPLRLSDAAILSAQLGEQPARIIHRDGQGYFLLVEQEEDGEQSYQLTIEYAKAFSRAPGQNQVAFEAPQSSVNRWTIRIPEPGVEVNVHPLIAATEVSPVVAPAADAVGSDGDEATDGEEQQADPNGEDPPQEQPATVQETSFALQPPVAPGPNETVLLAFFGVTPTVRIDWTPKSEGAAGLTALATVQASQTVTIDEGAMRTRAQLVYQISRAELTQLELLVPADQKVAGVFDPNVRQWEVAIEEDKQRITIQLFEPAAVTQRIAVELEKFDTSLMADNAESIPSVEALNVSQQQGTVLIRLDDVLRGEVALRRGLLQIDIAELSGNSGNAQWDFAYRYSSLPFELELQLEKVEPRITTTELVEVYLEPEQLTLDLFAKYQIERAGVFQLQLLVPEDYEIRQIRGQEGAGAAGVSVDNYHRSEEDPRQVTVFLSRRAFGIVGLMVELEKQLDDPNLLTPTGTASDYVVDFPRVNPASIESTNGRLVIYAPKSLEVLPGEYEGGRLLSFTEALADMYSLRGSRFANVENKLSFGFSSDPFTPGLSALRLPPQITVAQRLVVDVQPGVVKYSAVFQYEILYSGVRTLRIDLPAELAPLVRNQSNLFQESVIEPAPEDLPENYLAWQLQADRELIGTVMIQLTWEQELAKLATERTEQWSIPHLKPQDVDRAEGTIVIATSENIDVGEAAEVSGLRPIDPQTDLAAGTPEELKLRAARAYEFHQDWSLEVKAIRYQLSQLETTFIQQALFRMVNTLSGEQSVQALYRLRSAEQRLRMKLPGGVQVIRLRINGIDVTPEQGDGEEYLVPLRDLSAAEEFVLELIYRNTDPASGRFDIPFFVDKPAIHQAHLCAFLPARQALVHYGGDWMDSFSIDPESLLSGEMQSGATSNELVNQLADGIMNSADLDFESQGIEYVFSTLQPDASEQGGLSVTTISRRLLHSLLYLAFIVLGVIGLRLNVQKQVLMGAGVVVFAALVGVLLPVLYMELIDGYFVIGALLVFAVWIGWDSVHGLQSVAQLLPFKRGSSEPAASMVVEEEDASQQTEEASDAADVSADEADDESPPLDLAEEPQPDSDGAEEESAELDADDEAEAEQSADDGDQQLELELEDDAEKDAEDSGDDQLDDEQSDEEDKNNA